MDKTFSDNSLKIKPTAFLTITDGFAERMLVKTKFLKYLEENFRVILFTKSSQGEKKLKTYNLNTFEKNIWDIRTLFYHNFEENPTTQIKLKNIKKKNFKKYIIVKNLLNLMKLNPIRDLIFHLQWISIPESYDSAFEKYRPDLVICSSGGTKPEDLPFIKSAKKRGIPTVGIIQSWDNLTSKGFLYAKCDKFIVWNDIMKEELIKFHGCNQEDIFVSGPIHYDLYHDYSVTEQDLIRYITEKNLQRYKIILVASSPEWTYKDYDWICKVILESAQNGDIKFPIKLILRLHPNDRPDRYKALNGISDIIINHPSKFKGDNDWEQDEKEIKEFQTILRISDVVVCVASTVTIDASYFDTPVVNIAFEKNKVPYEISSARFYEYTHYRNILKYVRVAKNPQELISYINFFLEDKSRDRENRKEIIKQQCKYTDGMSAKRASEFIYEIYKKFKRV